MVLIFILLDRPDAQMDRFLSKHVLNIHSKVEANCRIDENSKTQKETSSLMVIIVSKFILVGRTVYSLRYLNATKDVVNESEIVFKDYKDAYKDNAEFVHYIVVKMSI